MRATRRPTPNPFEAAARQISEQRRVRSWRETAHPQQLPPPYSEWKRTLLVTGGRGSGKTFCASNILAEMITDSEPGEWAIIGPTFADARDTCMCSTESGLIVALGGRVGSEGQLAETGPWISDRGGWNISRGTLRLRNGSTVICDGGDDGAYRVQGKNLRGVWVDEVGLIHRWKTTWDESLRYAVRLDPARIIVTGTPKRNLPARELIKRLLADKSVVKRQLYTEDNRANLSESALHELLSTRGTALERQELYGDLIEWNDGALFDYDKIEENRLDAVPASVSLVRVVVAVDPSLTSREDSDETGIIVAGLGSNGHAYVLADRSCRKQPNDWARDVVSAYREYYADRIVAEVNNGGDMVGNTIKTIDADVPYSETRATRGKIVRAEPISAAYAQGRIHHIGEFRQLEDQLVNLDVTHGLGGRESEQHDDRADALVWAMTELGMAGSGMSWSEVYLTESERQQKAGEDDKRRAELGLSSKPVVAENPWLAVYGPTIPGIRKEDVA